MTPALFLHQVINASSRVVPGATLTFMQGHRKGAVFHDEAMRTPARNPFRTDSAGRVRLYLNAGETYEVTVETPRGERYQFVHVARAEGESVETVREVEVIREVPVERIVTVADPAQAALIEHLRGELEAAREKVKAAESAPPAELADLIDWAAPPKERQEALLVKLREVAGLIGLAEDRGGRAPAELYARRDRLESGIHFNRPTLTETI